MNDRTSYVGCTLGFLAGVLAGAGAALLLAPQPGRAARERVGRQLRHRAGSIRALKERLARRAKAVRPEARRPAEAESSAGGDGRRP
jgi:gas vesicle protein